MNSDEQEIRSLIDTWMSATKAGATETVLGLMTDDVKFLVPGREPFGKDEFERSSKEHAASGMHFEGRSEIAELQVLGEWAWMITNLSVTGGPEGGPATTRSGHTLTILRKVDGRWLLARDANLLS
jgi:uncharacterized protein (TIGR02246 family)